MNEIALSQLAPESRRKLFEGMGKTDKGIAQLDLYRFLKDTPLYTAGASFMMSRADYLKYLKDGEA